MTTFTASRTTGWLSAADCSIDDFAALVDQQTHLSDYPYADAVERNVLIYGEKLRAAIGITSGRTAVQTELMRALTDGPGIVVFKQAFGDLSVVDRATDAFLAQIAAEKAAGVAGGDHFAKPGANDRVWGALDKLAVTEPAVFADYYANDIIALISESWLGPDYQVTSQVNVVNPGGQAQTAHRDYHLGFMDAEARRPFPGPRAPAVAGADPAGRGRALRHAHRDRPDPLPALLTSVRARLPRLPPARVHRVLPAELHPAAAGEGRCRVLQPRPVPRRRHERLDRRPTDGQPAAGVLSRSVAPWKPSTGSPCAGPCSRCCWRRRRPARPTADLDNVIAASAEGYAFPTNLDRDQPIGGIAPQTQADLVRQAVAEDWTQEAFESALDAQAARTRPDRRLTSPPECRQSCWPPAGPTPVTRLPVRRSPPESVGPARQGGGRGRRRLHRHRLHHRRSRGREGHLRLAAGEDGSATTSAWSTSRSSCSRTGGPPASPSGVGREAGSLLNAAEVLGARQIKIGPDVEVVDGVVPPLTDVAHWAAELHQLAGQAAEVGTRVALEPLPFSNITDFRVAAELVAAADHPAAGLVVDIWHLERGPSTLADLAEIPGDKVFVVELNDAPAPQSTDLFHDTIHHRVLCGSGTFDVTGFIETLQQIGFAGPWGVEIISETHRRRPLQEALVDAHRTTMALFDNPTAH